MAGVWLESPRVNEAHVFFIVSVALILDSNRPGSTLLYVVLLAKGLAGQMIGVSMDRAPALLLS